MKNIRLVMAAAIKNNLRLRSVAIVLIGVVLICVIGVAAIAVTQMILPDLKAIIPSRTTIESHLSLIMYATGIMTIGVYASVFAFQSLTREKARGNVQALLATPLVPEEIWIGKSLAVFLPGLIFAEMMTLAAFLIVNYVYLVPEMNFVVNPWMIISNFLGVPLLYMAVILMVHVIGLTGKPATGNIIAQIFLPVMVSLFINLVARNVLNAGSWLFMVILLGLAAIIGIVVLRVRSKLTTEKIILSQ